MAEYLNQRLPAGMPEVEGANANASAGSGVSWGAVFAGALGAAALSLILFLLGTGFGLSSISPWTARGASATTIGIATILWITFTQIAASGIGGYLAGRLRTKWVGVRTDEVYFRDTAHGFLAWAFATLVTAAALTSTIGPSLERARKPALPWWAAPPRQASPRPAQRPRHRSHPAARTRGGRSPTSSIPCSGKHPPHPVRLAPRARPLIPRRPPACRRRKSVASS